MAHGADREGERESVRLRKVRCLVYHKLIIYAKVLRVADATEELITKLGLKVSRITTSARGTFSRFEKLHKERVQCTDTDAPSAKINDRCVPKS